MISGDDILGLGYPAGPAVGRALARARQLEQEGRPREAILEVLRQERPDSPSKAGRLAEPRPLAAAVEAASEAETANVEACRAKMSQLLRVPVLERGALMPDCCPAGGEEACIPVGGAVAARRAILPDCHSADICCSMYASFFTSHRAPGELLDTLARHTRFGAGGRREHELVHHPILDEEAPWENPFLRGLKSYAVRHMADQGDGNHFAYLGRLEPDVLAAMIPKLADAGYEALARRLVPAQEHGCYALVTHHGSRGLGAQLYKRGRDAAGRHTAAAASGIPSHGAWLDYDTEPGRAYWDALQFVGRWTRANHQAIHHGFLHAMPDAKEHAALGNEHNFVWKRGDLFYHGKGATPAWKDDEGRPLVGLIPLNMGAEILIVLGADNDAFLSFAPHGAGRNFSRRDIAKPFRDEEGNLLETHIRKAIAEATPGLDIRWWSGQPDISESPLGYKDAAAIRAQIDRFGLARVIGAIAPRGSIMAGHYPKPWERGRQTPKQRRQLAHRAERRQVASDLRQGRWEEQEEP